MAASGKGMQESHSGNAAAHGAAAMESMRHHGLPPTPVNYAVWFEFHAGTHAGLRRLLSVALSNRRVVDSYMMAELHDLFLANHPSRQAAREARSTLRAAATRIIEAGADADRYGNRLSAAAAGIESGASGLAGLIAELAAETAALSARSTHLGAELNTSGERIAELERQLAAAQRASMTDALTALPNRRAFDAMVLDHAGQAMNSGEALCLLMIDIDHFKRVNDTWGHAVGDAVIQFVAAILAQTRPEPARAARYGGEEFALLMPATSLVEAIAHAETLRAALAARRIRLRANAEPIGSITVSIGTARYEPGEAVSQWVERADAALYRAKHNGRNQVATLEAATELAAVES